MASTQEKNSQQNRVRKHNTLLAKNKAETAVYFCVGAIFALSFKLI